MCPQVPWRWGISSLILRLSSSPVQFYRAWLSSDKALELKTGVYNSSLESDMIILTVVLAFLLFLQAHDIIMLWLESDQSLPSSYQFITHQSSYYRRYSARDTDSAIKQTTHKSGLLPEHWSKRQQQTRDRLVIRNDDIFNHDGQDDKHKRKFLTKIQGGSNMTGTNCDLFTHK
jgi:hypothetical protein